MANSITDDLDKLLSTMCQFYADEGMAREVAVLGHSKASIRQVDYHNSWSGEFYEYAIHLEVPDYLFHQLAKDIATIEGGLCEKANHLTPQYEGQIIKLVRIVPELTSAPDWKEKAKTYVTGQGLTNQGRARSDNLAPKMSDGLLFRSQPEINLYRALKSLGVSFAPLPVFIRGGETYRRIEPDFVIVKDGILLVVEVDGDTVHRETPLEAHNRTTMLAHEGVEIERVNADECDTEDKAKVCAKKILSILAKLKSNRS